MCTFKSDRPGLNLSFTTYHMGDSGQISYLSGLQCTPLILKNGNKNTYLAALWGLFKKITCVKKKRR